MKIDATKMKSARDRRAMTQEALAHQARVNVRTVQRAENGEPIRHETLADLAAALGVPVVGLLKTEAANDVEPEQEVEQAQMQVLKRVESAETVVSLLERATMASLGCTAPPTPENMPHLRAIIGTIEKLLRDPWDQYNLPPLRFTSLLERLETIANLNAQLADLERAGLALYSAASTHFVKVPYHSDEGMVTGRSQPSDFVTAARFVIAGYENERLRVAADAIWPLQEEVDEVPF